MLMSSTQPHIHVQLAEIIASAANTLGALSDRAGIPLPSLHDVNGPTHAAEELLASAAAQEAATNIRSACGMMMALISTPYIAVQEASWSFHISSCIRVAVESKTAEIIRTLGEKDGVSVNEIAALNGMNPSKLGRVLRTLATCHIFRETRPGVFANNRLSAPLDSGVNIDSLVNTRPPWSPSHGIGASLCHMTDDVMVASTGLSQALLFPVTANSQSPQECAFQSGWGCEIDFWTWLELPANEARKQRLGLAMDVGVQMKGTLEGFDWSTLPESGTIVDVGGGLGLALMSVAKEHTAFKIIIQDRPKVLSVSEQVWKTDYPRALDTQQVSFQESDFFEPQPIKGATVYHLRHIMHDWADEFATKILRNLRDAADLSSTLIIVDTIIDYACTSQSKPINDQEDVPSSSSILLENHGNMFPYLKDINMLTLCNGKERTVVEWKELLSSAGWRIVNVFKGPMLAEIVAIPEPQA